MYVSISNIWPRALLLSQCVLSLLFPSLSPLLKMVHVFDDLWGHGVQSATTLFYLNIILFGGSHSARSLMYKIKLSCP